MCACAENQLTASLNASATWRLRESQHLHGPGWVDPQREAGVPQRGEDAGHLLPPRSILKIRAASCVVKGGVIMDR